jgi:PAS domain S-box-containing protein
MRDKDKAKEQATGELSELRRRVAELEELEIQWKEAEEELRIVAALDRVRMSTYKMREASDIQEVLVSLYEALKDTGLDFEDCSVQIVDEREESFGIAWQAQHRPYRFDSSRKIPIASTPGENSAVYEAWQNRRAIYRRNLDEEDPYNERILIREAYGKDIRSVLDVAFSRGTVAINSTQPDAFSETDVRTLERFAQVLSEAFIRFEDIRGVEESAERYRSIVEHSQDVIFRVDLAGNYLFISPVIESLTGYPPKEFHADWRIRHRITLPDDVDKVEQGFQEALLGKASRDLEYRMRRTDGKILWVSQTTFPIQGSEGRTIAIEGAIRDISQRKQAEEELRKHRDQLEELVKERTAELTEANEGLQAEIAERKRMEEALRKSEEKYRFLYEESSTANVVIGTDGTIQDVNNPLLEKLGYSKDEVVGEHALEFVVPEQREEAALQIEKAFRGEHTPEIDFDIRAKDGSLYTILFSPGQILFYEGGQPVGVLFTGVDITERKEMERALQESEERFREVAKNAQEWIWEMDASGLYTYASPVGERILGYKPEEVVGKKHFYDLFHPEDRIETKRAALEMFARKQPFRGFLSRSMHKNGKTVWLSTSGVPILDDEGSILGYRGADMDITRRKRMAEEVLKSEEKFRGIAERSFDAIFTTDLEGRITYASPATKRLSGYIPDEFIGKLFQNYLPESARPEAALMFTEIVKGRSIENLQVEMLRKDGSLAAVEINVSPIIIDEEVTGIQGIARDITERKRIEEELLKAQKLESIGVLAGGIAHDFNNILTVILGNISLARMYTDPGKISERLREAERASVQAKDLTQRLLTFSRGGAPIRKTASIAKLLKDSAGFALSGSNVRCEFSIPDDLWPVEVDEGQMRQVINNIVANAHQAMPDGGMVRVCAENVTVGAEDVLPLKDGQYVKISVEDQGVGIPEEHLQKIFDPFFTTKEKRSGLGLATSYSTIKDHDGHIAAESHVGIGTILYIYLPAYPERILVKEEKEEEELITGSGRILVMDDEAMIRETVSEMLDNIGYEVAAATDGAEAIDLYKEAKESGQPFEVVIVDLTVAGGMGGKEAVQKLMEIDPEVKAIVSSGYSDDAVMTDFRKYGFSGVIAKPYRIKELSEVLHRVMQDSS